MKPNYTPRNSTRKIVAGTFAAFATLNLTTPMLVGAVILGITLAGFIAIAQAATTPTAPPVAPMSLTKLESTYGQLKAQNVRYGYGAKAGDFSPDGTLARVKLERITKIDCSGLVRLGGYIASGNLMVLPDGSQIQLAWAGKYLHRVKNYPDVHRYMNSTRLFIAFIKPYTNGCGSVGHVWFIRQRNGKTLTVESHGGVGVNSRAWDSPTLKRQVYAVYELPTSK